jgi:RecA-family ATPase
MSTDSTGNSQQSAKILQYDRFHESRSSRATCIILDIQQETGLEFKDARLLYYHRGHAYNILLAPEREYCDAIETRVARQKAEWALPDPEQGNGADHSGIDWDAHDARLRANRPPIAERKSEQPEQRPPLPFVNMSTWDSEPIPEQDWTVLNRIPCRQCVLFSGEGAAGKSTVQLHLSAAHVLGRDWLGTMPAQGPALFIDAEDDKDVMHRRLAAITNHYGVTFNDLIKGGLHLISLVGEDAVLATASRGGKIEPTALYKQIHEAVGDIKPAMIGVASSANVYAGSEIDRSQVQQFVSLMTRLAILANGSLALISHPSLTGITSESGISGTTQWHNAMRARFYMKGVKPENGEEPDNDLREIVFKKNNYGPISENIVVRYQNGLFLPVPGVSSLDQAAQDAKGDDVFLTLLRRFTAENRNVSGSPNSNNYAPGLFAQEEEATQAGVNTKMFEAAMRRLFKAALIWNEPYGRPSRPMYRLAWKE